MAEKPQITTSSIGDLGVSTLPELHKGVLVNIATQLQDYTFANYLLRKGMAITYDSGKSFSWRALVNGTGTAQNVGAGYQDKTSIVDTTVEATADWRSSKVDWSMIKPYLQMNMGAARIVDMEMEQEKAAMISWAELLENNAWGPPVAVDDTITPYGINTWIVKNASTGFNGGAPSGWTTIGLNPTTYAQWKNYTALYTNINDTDFIRKLKTALRKTEWKSPVSIPDPTDRPGRLFFSNNDFINGIEEYLKSSNESIGMNILNYQGRTVINQTPIVYVPKLDADTTNPFYFIHMAACRLARLKNWWMRPTKLTNAPGHHTVEQTYYDSYYNMFFLTRRTSGVLATAATYPS